jgi:pimeloyl-ACP methyl ester carboxylesterase
VRQPRSKPPDRGLRDARRSETKGPPREVSADVTTEHVPVAGTVLHLLEGGTGRPCLVLHGIEGHEGWLAFHESLAEHASVLAPSHPGYGQTECPDWIESVAHQAVFYNWFLQEAGLEEVDLVGVGLGGWIAAQMAVMQPRPVRHLALVDAAGIRPKSGEILDIFVIPWRQVIERGFHDPQHAAEYQRIYGAAPIQDFGGPREAGRTMTMRMCFKPYMSDPALPAMLARLRMPTLVVWGQQDAIVPLECGRLYQQAIPGATLDTIEQCGHLAHLEQPQRLAARLHQFFTE